MNNHNIVFGSLQKYYSALKSLEEFGITGDFFDDISNLDKFFSECRNITFVIQKNLKTPEDKDFYIGLKQKYLINNKDAQWLVNKRNETTKENPFNLKKELIFDLYVENEVVRIKNDNLVLDYDESFSQLVDFLYNEILIKISEKQVYFTSRIIFTENNQEIDFSNTIKRGLECISNFMNEFLINFNCDCAICNKLREKIKDKYINIRGKNYYFVRDYSLSLDKRIDEGERAEILISCGTDNINPIQSLRVPLENSIFKESMGDINAVFLSFVKMYTVLFKMSNTIMPVFMIVYNDNTFRLFPFYGTNKATFYRKAIEVILINDFKDAQAAFYCGEYYAYKIDETIETVDKFCFKREKMEKLDVLSFSMVTKNEGIETISFDEDKINDNNYVKQVLSKGKEKNTISSWLSVIYRALKMNEEKNNN